MALARFQIRNGLRVSGFLDSRTYAALNVSAQERLKQLETNLARVRSMLKFNKAPRYVLVNVPAFTLQAVDRGNLALTSNVVVGKPARATPAVSAQIVEVNFYPTWTRAGEHRAKPISFPSCSKDPSYFINEHFSVLAKGRLGSIRTSIDWTQAGGGQLPLRAGPRHLQCARRGAHQHAEQAQRLYARHAAEAAVQPVGARLLLRLRAGAAGARARRLAARPARLDAGEGAGAAENGKSINVALGKSVPVHFVYLTAFVSENGMVQFRPDIYGRDAPWRRRQRGPERRRRPAAQRRHALASSTPLSRADIQRRRRTATRDIRTQRRGPLVALDMVSDMASRRAKGLWTVAAVSWHGMRAEARRLGLTRPRLIEIAVAVLLTLAAVAVRRAGDLGNRRI